MKTILRVMIGLAIAVPGMAQAAGCPDGQVEKCFVDGSNSNCVCMAEAEDVAENPAPEPDGFLNPDE